MNSARQPRKQTDGFWTPQRAVLTLTVFALLALSSFAGCNSQKGATPANSDPPKATVTVKPGSGAGSAAQPATSNEPVMLPASALDAALKTVDGKPFKFSELKGKVLVIDLWATWCNPCRYEVPELVKMQSEYGPRGFEVIGLDIDPGSDTPAGVKDFMKEFNVNYKVAFAERPLAASLMRGGNIPQSIVVDRDGRVVEHTVGYSANVGKRLRDVIEQALGK